MSKIYQNDLNSDEYLIFIVFLNIPKSGALRLKSFSEVKKNNGNAVEKRQKFPSHCLWNTEFHRQLVLKNGRLNLKIFKIQIATDKKKYVTMLGAIYSFAEVFISAIYYIFYVSLKIGQILVHSTIRIFSSVISFLVCVQQFFSELAESCKVFFEDLQGAAGAIVIGLSQVFVIFEYFCRGLNEIANLFGTIGLAINTIGQTTINLFSAIGNLFVSLKQLLIIFGKGVWFAIKFFPETLIYTLLSIFHGIGYFLQTIKSICVIGTLNFKAGLIELFNFITDVPLESLIGLTVAACLVYILVQFYMTIFNYLSDKVTSVIRTARQRLTRRRTVYARLRPIVNSRTTPSKKRPTSEPNGSDNPNDPDYKFCIICKERPKCILTLPCRHVCLCSECLYRLQLYNNKCPICRVEFQYTMKIFV